MLTPKREAFAAALARGLSQAAAYREAFEKSRAWKDATVWRKASLLAAVGEVQARVAELQAKAAADNEFTVTEHLQTLATLRDEARLAGQYAAAIKAEESRGKCAGFYTEKHEHTGKGGGPIELARPLASLSTEELRDAVKRLGREGCGG